VNHKGVISPRDIPGAVERQRERLIREGVMVEEEGMDSEFRSGGGGKVELALYGWFPGPGEINVTEGD
jgi:alkylated DNA nucleotide flippase Atl1